MERQTESQADNLAELVWQLPLHKEADLISCVYFLLRGSRIVYVGQTTDLVARIKSHRFECRKRFDSVRYLMLDQEKLNGAELFFIRAFNPEYNRTKRGFRWSPHNRERYRRSRNGHI